MLPEMNICHNRTAKIQLSNLKYELAQFLSILTHTQKKNPRFTWVLSGVKETG
jgi:hypothetical protein